MINKKAIFCFSLLTLFSCGQNNTQKLDTIVANIVNGTTPHKNQFTSVLALTHGSAEKRYCTGNLIESNLIITAAHCFLNPTLSPKMRKKQALIYKNTIEAMAESDIKKGRYTSEFFNKFVSDRKNITQLLKDLIVSTTAQSAHYTTLMSANNDRGILDKKLESSLKEVKINPTFLEYYFHYVFKDVEMYGHKLSDGRNIEFKDFLKYDQAKLILDTPVKSIKPSAYESKASTYNLLNNEDTELFFVGYGRKSDTRIIRFYTDLSNAVRSYLEDEKLTKIEKENLQFNIDQIDQSLGKLKEKEEVGSKEYITRTLFKKEENTISTASYNPKMHPYIRMYMTGWNNTGLAHTLNVMTSAKLPRPDINSGLKGLCNGDSGGPVFIKDKDAKFIQIATITAVNFCGDRSTSTLIKD